MIAIVVWGDALESVAKKKYRRSGDNNKGRQKQSSSAAGSRERRLQHVVPFSPAIGTASLAQVAWVDSFQIPEQQL